MNTEFVNATMKLEARRRIVIKEREDSRKPSEIQYLTHQMNLLTEKIDQYHLVIKAFNEMNKRDKK